MSQGGGSKEDDGAEEEDDDEFEDDEEEYYGETDDMQYEGEDQLGGGGAEDEEDEEEEEYDQDYQEDDEIDALNNFAPASKYDYGTDHEAEDEDRVAETEISQEDFNNFLHKCTLNLPPQLSQKFVRLAKEFNNNIDYIMNYVYKLVGQVPPEPAKAPKAAGSSPLAEKNKFHNKYENLIKQSTELCRKYTGPHSVL